MLLNPITMPPDPHTSSLPVDPFVNRRLLQEREGELLPEDEIWEIFVQVGVNVCLLRRVVVLRGSRMGSGVVPRLMPVVDFACAINTSFLRRGLSLYHRRSFWLCATSTAATSCIAT